MRALVSSRCHRPSTSSVLTYSDPVRAAAVAPSWRFGDETMMVTLSQRREERVIEAS